MQFNQHLYKKIVLALLGVCFAISTYFSAAITYAGMKDKFLHIEQLLFSIKMSEGYFVFWMIIFGGVLLTIIFFNLTIFLLRKSMEDEISVEQVLSIYENVDTKNQPSFFKKISSKFIDLFIENNR